ALRAARAFRHAYGRQRVYLLRPGSRRARDRSHEVRSQRQARHQLRPRRLDERRRAESVLHPRHAGSENDVASGGSLMHRFRLATAIACALLVGVAGCASTKKKPTTHPVPITEKDAVEIATDYLRD